LQHSSINNVKLKKNDFSLYISNFVLFASVFNT
jgi:hypothetical protein